MKRAQKLLSLLLVLTLSLSLSAPVGAYSDTSGHWAESSIDRWSAEGVLNGKGGDSFDPDGGMTRAEFAQMLCNMMGYTQKAENIFADVPDDAWYADAMLKLAAAGVISGVGGNMAAPDAPITREQAAVMLCRAFSIKTDGSAAMGFADAGSVSSWARDSVAALAGMGMINGVGDNKVAPKLNINRASVAKLVDNMVAEYVTADKTITGEVKGVVIVAGGAKVTIENASVTAPILVAPAAGGAKVELTGTTSAENVVVAAANAAVTVGKNASAETVTAAADKAEVKVEGTVDAVAVEGEGAKVDVSGAVGTVSTEAANTTVAVSGTVESVEIAEGADKANVTTTSTAKIDSVTTAAEDVKVSGTGSVGAVTAEGGSADVSTKGTEVKNEGADSVTAGGNPVASGDSATSAGSTSTGSTGGSSGGGGGHTHSWGDGEVTTAATCTTAGVKAYTCSCGETKTEEIAALGHTEVVDEVVYPTCTETGLTEGSHCSACNTVLVAQQTVAALGHTEMADKTDYATDAIGHWYACTRCGEVTVAKAQHSYGDVKPCTSATCSDCGYETEKAHVWGEPKETKAATCTEKGENTYTCSECGETQTEEIALIPHTEVVDEAVAATCTEAGKGEGKHCSVCETILAPQVIIPAKGHTEVAVAAVAATCTEAGKTEGKRCSVCDTVLVEQTVVDALGHTEVVDAAVAATCTTAGKTEGKHCSVCNTTITAQTTIAALGHDYETVVTKEPTETVEGEKTSTCKRCGDIKKETIPMLVTADVWVEAKQAYISLYWVKDTSYKSFYYVNGERRSTFNYTDITPDLADIIESGYVKYEISEGENSEAPYLTAENIVNVVVEERETNVTIEARENGSYKFIPGDSGYTGKYRYELLSPEGEIIRAGIALANGTVWVSPYEGCKFRVREMSWEPETGTSTSITVTLSKDFKEYEAKIYDFEKIDVTVSTEKELSDNLKKAGKITLADSINVTSIISISYGGEITLDLNGKTLNLPGDNKFLITDGKVLHIIDSSEEKTGKIVGGSVGVSTGCIFTSADVEYDWLYCVAGSGSAPIRDIELTNVTAHRATISGADNVLISGAEIGRDNDDNLYCSDCKKVKINNTKVIMSAGPRPLFMRCDDVSAESSSFEGLLVSGGGTTTLTDVTMERSENNYAIISVIGSESKLNIVSGKYIIQSFALTNDGGTVAITGGTFTAFSGLSDDIRKYVDEDNYDIAETTDSGKTTYVVTAKATTD